MPSYGLICPFLDQSPRYAYGVEFGMLYARMDGGDEDEIEDYFCRANQDQILLAASRLGWHVATMEPWGSDWLRFRLERKRPAS
jgi:hypothetical protein